MKMDSGMKDRENRKTTIERDEKTSEGDENRGKEDRDKKE